MAMSEPASLLPLAESIADGSPIDWDAVEARASAEDQAIIRELRIVANLALLHRSLPADPLAPPAPTSRRSTRAPAIGNWGHLALVERLGGGAAGEVYRAWDPHLERDVALKLLRINEATDDPQSSPIVREGRLLARVRHPNVTTVHGVAVHDGRFGLWMDLVRGATLEQLLLKQGPFSAREASLIGIDLCRALAAMHSAGLIHRDVKAQNVMREDGGRIVLMDLGTGRELDPHRDHCLADLAGTPLYLAPEIFDGQSASERTDLYSLGVLLYHLVTGSFPVRATALDELTEGHAKGTGVRVRDARADLPAAFVRVIDRAIAKDPQQRYASAGALEAALAAALDDSAAPSGASGNADRASQAASDFSRTTNVSRTAKWERAGWLLAALAAAIAIAAIGWPVLRGRIAPTAGSSQIRSIAVLPMVNLSGDLSQDYFADGMTDALIDNLAMIRPLRVISRTSVMQFKGTKTALGDIAKALNVDAVLEASVLRSGDRVRISAALVDAATDRHVWVDTYERDVRDVLTLQSDLARTIAREVKIQLTPQQQAGFAMVQRIEPDAQEAYLQGRYYWNKRTEDGLQKALAYFEHAAAIDPTFARAYAGQADVYNLLPQAMLPSTAYRQAKAAATKALELNPTLAEAYTSLAFATFAYDRDWPGAEAAFQRALQLNPGYETAHHWYGDYLVAMGRFDEGLAQFELARAIDPLASAVRTSIGGSLYNAHRYDEAIAHLRASLDIDPGNPNTHTFLAACYEKKGMLSEARAEARRALEIEPSDSYALAELGRVAALSGDRTEARRIATGLTARARQERIPGDAIAYIYAALGDKDRAFAFLDEADQERWPGLLWAKVAPELDPLRADPRFDGLLRKLRLSP